MVVVVVVVTAMMLAMVVVEVVKAAAMVVVMVAVLVSGIQAVQPIVWLQRNLLVAAISRVCNVTTNKGSWCV